MSNIKKQNTKAVKKDTAAKKSKKTTTTKKTTTAKKITKAKKISANSVTSASNTTNVINTTNASNVANTSNTTKENMVRPSYSYNQNQTVSKSKGLDLKIAFYLVIAIIVLLIIYFVSFKKPKTPVFTNENSLISGMLSGDTEAKQSAYSLNLPSTFKLFRQGNANSSGPATILNVLSFYGKESIFTEEIVEGMKSLHSTYHKGTCVNQFKEIFSTIRFKYYDDTTYRNIPQLQNVEVGLKLIEESVKAGYPVVVGWNKKPGHWSMVIGYDNKSTTDTSDDVITMADPDNSKGISNVNAGEFDEKWNFGDFFIDEPAAHVKSKKCFIILDKYN